MAYQPIYAVSSDISSNYIARVSDDIEGSMEADGISKSYNFPKSSGNEDITNIRVHINYYTTGTWANDLWKLQIIDSDGIITTEEYTFVAEDFGGDNENHKEVSFVPTDTSWQNWDVIDARVQVTMSATRVKGGDGITMYIDAMWIEVDYTPLYKRAIFYSNEPNGGVRNHLGIGIDYYVSNICNVGWYMAITDRKTKARGLTRFDTSVLPDNAIIQSVRFYKRTDDVDYQDYDDFDIWIFRYLSDFADAEGDWSNSDGFDTESDEYEGILFNTVNWLADEYFPRTGVSITTSWINKTGYTGFLEKSSDEDGVDSQPENQTTKNNHERLRAAVARVQATLIVEYTEVSIEDLRKTIDEGIITKLMIDGILTKMVKGS